ncbi:MAG: hypothetical protein ACE5I1_17000, partial [bacterium]
MLTSANNNSPDAAKTQKLEALLDLAAALGQQKDYQETLRLVVQQLADLLNAVTATVMMINPQTRKTVKAIFKGRKKADDPTQHKINTHVSGWMIKNKQSFFSENLATDARFSKRLFRDLSQLVVLGVP